MTSDREYDVVVHGATGFVGRLTADYLAAHAPAGTRIALSGRSKDKLAAVRDDLGAAAADWPLLVTDAHDERGVTDLAESTRVVTTTVGPYVRHGMPLLAACARAGTHYSDLTGEVMFMRRAIDDWHERAAETGARIVHACGFDSIPSDLGVLLLHEQADADAAGGLTDTTFVLDRIRGGASGGTLASMTVQLDEMRRNADARRLVADPYALSPDRDAEPSLGDESDLRIPTYDADLGIWAAPFPMAGVNTRVVRRSNALQEWAYGRQFRYREVTGAGSGPLGLAKAAGMTAGLGALVGGLLLPPTRAVLDRVLPSPGEGPSKEKRENGYFRVRIHARTQSGASYVATVAAQGDPGYAATAVMLGESALALSLDGDALPARAGVLTPATAMGPALVDRLRRAGFELSVERAA